MDLHERRFLTAHDRAYLEEIELILSHVEGVTSERLLAAVRSVARELQRARTQDEHAVATTIFPYGGARAHAEVLAALIVTPRAPSRFSLVALALLAAVAGLLGMRVVLTLLFQRFEPVRIGWMDVTLALGAVVMILLATGSRWLPARLRAVNWFWLSLALGLVIGLGAARVLRSIELRRTIVTLPLWGAAILAVACGALTWLLTWPDDQNVFRGPE